MGEIERILHEIDLEGRTSREGAEEVLSRAQFECPDELEDRKNDLIVDHFISRLGRLRRSRAYAARIQARRRRFVEGVEVTVVDLMNRWWVVEDGTNRNVMSLGPADRKYLLAVTDNEIDTLRKERDFIERLDELAGDQVVGEALSEEQVEAVYSDIMADD